MHEWNPIRPCRGLFRIFLSLRAVLRTHSVKQISGAKIHAKDTRGEGRGHFQIAADQQQQTFQFSVHYHVIISLKKQLLGSFPRPKDTLDTPS